MVIHTAVARFENELYAISRILIGLLLLQHAYQKWFGVYGFDQPLTGMFLFAALIETFVGIALVFGFWTRLAALLGGVELLVAYFMIHAPQNALPLVNGGELPLLYVAAFIALLARGNGAWSIESLWAKKEAF